jgi:hypothetical protein
VLRASLAALALVALTAGCGSSESGPKRSAPAAGSLEQLWQDSGQAVALIPGTADYAPGDVRFSFLVVTNRGRVVTTPTARVWLARSRDARPFERTTARLVSTTAPGASTEDEEAHSLYVAHLRIRRPGRFWVLARPVGSPIRIGGIQELAVKSRPASPAIGSRAYPSRTPTIASAHGRLSSLTTRTPPDRGLLRYSIAGSLAAHVPFVVVFATPRFCESRTCGPTVDVVDAVRRQMHTSRVRFIHVEIYAGNNPAKGFNRWVRQWHLPSEPWTFLVGRDGRIKAKFEGSVGRAELLTAVRRYLLAQ